MYLITGASGGIGNEIFKKLSKDSNVIGICNKKQPKNTSKGIYVNVDLIKDQEIQDLINNFKMKLKNITLIQLAASSFDGLIANYSKENIIKTFELNIFSNISLVQNILPLMIDQKWGRIIHFSSIIGSSGAKGAGIYASSKSALIGYNKTLSKEYGRFGITSNIIELGYFERGLIKSFSDKKLKEIISNTSSRRLGKTDDIISAIKFIEKSDFYNGEILKLNGGL